MAETKNYYVKYSLDADASKLESTLTTLGSAAKNVADQITALKGALANGFSEGAAFDSMVKNYNAAIEKIQKKNPFAVPVGASLKESAFTAIQKQLESYNKFEAFVGAKLREESLTAIQTQLNGRTYTINVEANITGVKNASSGSNSGVKLSTKGNISEDAAKTNTAMARSWSKIADAASKGKSYSFRLGLSGNFGDEGRVDSLKTAASAIARLAKIGQQQNFAYQFKFTGIQPGITKLNTLQTAIDTLRGSLKKPFFVNVQTGTGAKQIKGAGKATAAGAAQPLPVEPVVPPGAKPVQLEGEVTNVVNALAKSVGTVGVEGMVNFVKAAKTVVGEIGGLQGIISFVKGAKGVAGEIGGLQGIIGSVKAAQSVAGEIGGISGIVSSVKAAATVAGEVSGLQGIISTIKADGVKGGPIPIEGKLDSAAIIEQAKLIKLPPIPMPIKLGWGTEEQSKQSQIKALKDKLKPLPMTVELDISKAKAKLDELKAHANKMNPLKLSAQVTGGKSGASNATQATASGKNALTPANIGRATAKAVGMSPDNYYTRFRKWSYPFTGNTSFGASTPAAISMAKGMGMMFAVSGLMSTVTNAFTQATEYENVMKTVKAILATNDTSGGFAGRYAAMENTIRKVGRETKFTAPEVAGAARFMAMAGLGTEDINAASMPIANLALVGDNDLSTTADKMTNIMTSFGLLKGLSSGQKKANMIHTSDVLTNTFTKSNTDLIQLAEAMQYAGPMSHLTGTSLEDAAAMVGVMGNAGIQSSMAGTTLRMMYQNIIKPNKKQMAEWDRLGIQRTDSNGRVRDIFNILKVLRAKITGTTDLNAKIDKDSLKTMGAEVMALFRTTAGAGTAALLENLGEAINLAKSNREANGVAQNIADEKKNTIQGLWAQVTSTFTDQNVNTVSEFTNTIKEMLRNLRDWLQTTEAAETLKSIYQMAKSILEVFQWVAGLWKDLYNFAPTLTRLFIQTQFAFTQLGFLISPFVQLTSVVSSLGTAISKVVNIATGLSAVNTGVAASGAAGSAALLSKQSVSTLSAGGIGVLASGFLPMPRKYNLLWRKIPAENVSFLGSRGKTAFRAGDALTGRIKGRFADEYAKRAKLYGRNSHNNDHYAFADGEGLSNGLMFAGEGMMLGATVSSSKNGMPWRFRLHDTASVNYTSERQRAIKARQYERAAEQANKIKARAKSIYGMGGRATRAFTAGFNLITFTQIFDFLKRSIGYLVTKSIPFLAKGFGALLSPVGILTSAVVMAGISIWKIHDRMDKIQKRYVQMDKDLSEINSHHAILRNSMIDAGVKAGFLSASFGYNKSNEFGEDKFSLQGVSIADSIQHEDMKEVNGLKIAKAYLDPYKNLLPEYVVNDFYKNNMHKGIYNEEVNDNARKVSLIAQWANMAANQQNLQQDMTALYKAMFVDRDNAKVQNILEAYRPSQNAPRMYDLANAESVYGISNPQKYYEWQVAQYKTLEAVIKPDSPLRKFANALAELQNAPDIKKLSSGKFVNLAKNLFGGVAVDYNGQKAYLTFDKLGRVDWFQLAQTVNNSIPLSARQQMELLDNIKEQLVNDPTISKLQGLHEMLDKYLYQIANKENPYTQLDMSTTENWGSPGLPGNTKMTVGSDGTVSWNQFGFNNKFSFGDSFGESIKKAGGSIILADIEEHKKHPERFGITNNNVAPQSTVDPNKTVTPPSSDQSAYDSKYNRSMARPTQIIFKIDQLCKFDNMKVAEGAEKQDLLEAMGEKVTAAIQEIFNQAASEFAIVGNA